MDTAKKNFDIPALTGVRFLAVSMIFLKHYRDIQHVSFINTLFENFYFGVNIFFVLSGFLICYRYYAEASFTKPFLFNYFLRRFSRVYPLFFLITTLTFVFFFFSGNYKGQFWVVYFLNITFLKGFSSWFMFTGVFSTWSLTVEETFYIFFPLIALLIKRYSIFFSQIIFIWIVGFLLFLIFHKYPFHGFFKGASFIAFATFFGRCFEFFAGLKLALIIKKNNLLNNTEIGSVKFFKISKTYLGLCCMAVFILVVSTVRFYCPINFITNVCVIMISNILFPIGVVIFFYGLIKEITFVKRILSSATLSWLGKGSYAFFLIHASIISEWVQKHITGQNKLFLFVFLYVLSIMLYKCVEFPLNKYLRLVGNNFFKKRLALTS